MKTLLKSIQYGMLDYIDGIEEPEYSSEDVNQCITLLLEFMTFMGSEPQTSETATYEVQELVLSLNDLNARCFNSLIETSESEDICKFIDKVITAAGLEFDHDITAKWRQW
jgi:hypothetical protein